MTRAYGTNYPELIFALAGLNIGAALDAAGGVQKKAAELLHIKPTTLNEMIKRYDIRPRRRKASSGGTDPDSAELGPDPLPES